MIYTPGKQLAVADALSRAPNHEADAGEVAQIKGLEAYVGMIVRTMPMSDGRLVEIRQATLGRLAANQTEASHCRWLARRASPVSREMFAAFVNVQDEPSVADEVGVQGHKNCDRNSRV